LFKDSKGLLFLITKKITLLKSWVMDRSDIFLPVFLGLTLGFIIGKQPYMAFFMIVGVIILTGLYNKPVIALALFTFLLPFYRVPELNIPVLIKGTEPIYLIATFTIFVAVLNVHNSKRVPRLALILISVMMVIFTISVFRSLEYMEMITLRNVEDGRERLSDFQYILKNLVRPMFFFFPVIVVVKFLKDEKSMELILKAIVYATLVFSAYILFIYFTKVFGRSAPQWGNEFYKLSLGLERNSAANLLIFGFPFFIARYFLKKSPFNIMSIIMVMLAISFLFTRTAYVTVVFSFILYLIISRRTKYMPILIIAGVITFFTFIVSSSIMERASKGMDSGDINEISAGRVGNMWLPLIDEYFGDPDKLLLGTGIYAIVNSNSVKLGITPDTMLHPHNMYIELLIDAGIITLFLFVLLLLLLLRKILKSARSTNDIKLSEYQFAIFTSISSYLVAGMTGRSFWPGGKNALFWVIIGLGFVIIRLIQENYKETEPAEETEPVEETEPAEETES